MGKSLFAASPISRGPPKAEPTADWLFIGCLMKGQPLLLVPLFLSHRAMLMLLMKLPNINIQRLYQFQQKHMQWIFWFEKCYDACNEISSKKMYCICNLPDSAPRWSKIGFASSSTVLRSGLFPLFFSLLLLVVFGLFWPSRLLDRWRRGAAGLRDNIRWFFSVFMPKMTWQKISKKLLSYHLSSCRLQVWSTPLQQGRWIPGIILSRFMTCFFFQVIVGYWQVFYRRLANV